MTDILDLIDQATGCQQCSRQLGPSPSGDFCSPRCQQRWHEARSDLFAGYESAEYEGFAGLGWLLETVLRPSSSSEGPPYTYTLPPAGDGPSFTLAGLGVMGVGREGASGPAAWFPASCDEFDMAILYGGSRGSMAAAIRSLAAAGQAAIDSVHGLAEALAADRLPDDPRERALELRRRRNTGPQQRQRAPRRIKPRGCL